MRPGGLGKGHGITHGGEFRGGSIEPSEPPPDLCAMDCARFVQDLEA
jgi:hypothetical protein